MKQRMFFIVLVVLLAISCSTGTANLRIQKAAEINHKKLGTVAFVVNDPTGEETFTRLKECIPEPVEETVAEGGVSNEDGSASAGFSLSISSNKPRIKKSAIDPQELAEIKNLISASVQSIPGRVPEIQVVPEDQADTVIELITTVKKEKSWKTRKTNDPAFGMCYSQGEDNPRVDLTIDMIMNVNKKGETVQQVTRKAGSEGTLPYNTDCYFSLKPGETREPEIISECQTRTKRAGQEGYLKASVNFDEWFATIKNIAFKQIPSAIVSPFLILEENVPVIFYKIKKPEGVKEANGHLSNGNWSEAKEIYENLISSLSSTPDLNPEDEAKFYHNYAITLMAEGDFEKAMEWLVKAKGLVDTDRHDRAIETLKYLIENEKKLNEQK